MLNANGLTELLRQIKLFSVKYAVFLPHVRPLEVESFFTRPLVMKPFGLKTRTKHAQASLKTMLPDVIIVTKVSTKNTRHTVTQVPTEHWPSLSSYLQQSCCLDLAHQKLPWEQPVTSGVVSTAHVQHLSQI